MVISASRRTDIPAFYMSWFLERLQAGFFEVQNPFSKATYVVDARPGVVAAIVFWSRNYGPLLPHLETLCRDYKLWLNFTINTRIAALEPRVPATEVQLSQIRVLARALPPEAITWRFDPIVTWSQGGRLQDNLADFDRLARAIGALGVRRCHTSFVCHYRKVLRRLAAGGEMELVEPSVEHKIEILRRLDKIARQNGIEISLCCQPDLVAALPTDLNVRSAACVDGRAITSLYGTRVTHARDRSQRPGCGCTRSRDLGSYGLQPCHHRCVYCYANE